MPNSALWWVVGGASAFLALVLFVPAAQGLFHFAPLRAGDMALSFGAGVAWAKIGPCQRRVDERLAAQIQKLGRVRLTPIELPESLEYQLEDVEVRVD